MSIEPSDLIETIPYGIKYCRICDITIDGKDGCGCSIRRSILKIIEQLKSAKEDLIKADEMAAFYGDEDSWGISAEEDGWLYMNYIIDDSAEGRGTCFISGKKAREFQQYRKGRK